MSKALQRASGSAKKDSSRKRKASESQTLILKTVTLSMSDSRKCSTKRTWRRHWSCRILDTATHMTAHVITTQQLG
jgi:hypothetical protein